MTGCGSKEDPIRFPAWITGNVIHDDDKQEVVVISDGEDDSENPGYTAIERQASSLNPPRCPSVDSDGDAFWDAPQSQAPSSAGPESPANEVEVETYDNDDEDEEDGIIIVPDESEGELYEAFMRSIPQWSDLRATEKVKQELDDEVSLLSSSQETQSIAQPYTPKASQDSRVSLVDELSPETFDSWTQLPSKTLTGYSLKKDKLIGSPYTQDRKSRKRQALYKHVPEQLDRLRNRRERLFDKVTGNRNSSECWLYVDKSIRYRKGTIQIPVQWTERGQTSITDLNIGFISMFIEGCMTDRIKEGIINEKWTASHLCGNWLCLNHHHIHAENHETNMSRNPCFADVYESCGHTPPCL
ncbi:hypothetical protein BDV96DRAFT_585204, partial [Lophiotrema nucula]